MNLPNIPQIPSTVDSKVRQAFNDLRSWFTTMASSGGIPSVNDITTGDVGLGGGNVADSNSSALEIPLAPAWVNPVGGISNILVTWGDSPNKNSVTLYEVWRSEARVVTSAVKIGSTPSTMLTDTPPENLVPVTYYYWVRGVNRFGKAGAWSTAEGTPGSLGINPDRVIDLLTQNSDIANDKSLFLIDPVYGVVINTAVIKDASISSAMVGSLVVDKLAVTGTDPTHIGNLIANNVEAQEVVVRGNLKSNDYSAVNGTGWIIRGTSDNAEFNDIKARGDIEASSIGATCPVPMARITDLYVDTLQIAGNAVTIPWGNNATGLYIESGDVMTAAAMDLRGGSAIIVFSVNVSALGEVADYVCTLWRDTTSLGTFSAAIIGSVWDSVSSAWVYRDESSTFMYTDIAPATGNHTYKISCVTDTCAIIACNMSIIGARR